MQVFRKNDQSIFRKIRKFLTATGAEFSEVVEEFPRLGFDYRDNFYLDTRTDHRKLHRLECLQLRLLYDTIISILALSDNSIDFRGMNAENVNLRVKKNF